MGLGETSSSGEGMEWRWKRRSLSRERERVDVRSRSEVCAIENYYYSCCEAAVLIEIRPLYHAIQQYWDWTVPNLAAFLCLEFSNKAAVQGNPPLPSFQYNDCDSQSFGRLPPLLPSPQGQLQLPSAAEVLSRLLQRPNHLQQGPFPETQPA